MTTAQSAYKNPGTRTPSGMSSNEVSMGPCGWLASPKSNVDVIAVELELDGDVDAKVVCESNLKV